MNDLRQAAQQALECLKGVARGKYDGNAAGVCAALKAALEQQQAESVPAGLTLAVIGNKHFGNPIPPQWYAAAKELVSSTTPPQQQAEPVAWYDGEKFYGSTFAASVGLADMIALRPLYTTPPQQQADPVALDKIKHCHTKMRLFDFEQHADHEYAGLPHRPYASTYTEGCYLCATLAEIERLQTNLEQQAEPGQEPVAVVTVMTQGVRRNYSFQALQKLPDGVNNLYTASPQQQAEPVQEPVVIPREDSQEAAKAIQAMLAEYQYPANPTNAARAGWRAARLYTAIPQQQAEPIGWLDGNDKLAEFMHRDLKADHDKRGSATPKDFTIPVYTAPPQQQAEPVCWCHKCNENRLVNNIPFSMTRMILCPTCGNKRCPKASDHRLGCTDSNAAGQAGSAYPALPQQQAEPVATMKMLHTYGNAPPQQQAEPVAQRKSLSDFDARGIAAANLTFWHRLKEQEAHQLVKLFIDHLAPPQQQAEPVCEVIDGRGEVDWISFVPPAGTPLYTAAPQRQWVGLTDAEIEDAIDDGFSSALDNGNVSTNTVIRYIRIIEAKLKEKNT